MITKEERIGASPLYPIETIYPPDEILFFDIETTGLSARTCHVFLIGVMYRKQGCWQLKQWLIANKSEEPALLKEFLTFTAFYRYLFHYNGTSFDLPFLRKRMKEYEIEDVLDRLTSVDLYKQIFRQRHIYRLPNYKQKTMESFFGYCRQDQLSGQELIPLYHSYEKNPVPSDEALMLLHNRDDMAGMLYCLWSYTYVDLAKGLGVEATHSRLEESIDYNGNKVQELIIKLHFPQPLAGRTSILFGETYERAYCMQKADKISAKDLHDVPNMHGVHVYFMGRGDSGLLNVRCYEGTLRYYYPDYKNYYYLPEEDIALHKSVAAYVDKKHRTAARPETCYIRQSGSFLPQFDKFISPYFQENPRDKHSFFQITPAFMEDSLQITKYCQHLLRHIMSNISHNRKNSR